MNEALHRLAVWLASSKRTLVFTGAGISTGSGIPDFRGPQGLWKKTRPVYFDEFLTSEDARKRHWEYKLEGWNGFRDAQPNSGHLALIQLERMGMLHWVVTQNIDGLHSLAGHDPSKVIELHGTNRKIECVQCGRMEEPDPVFETFRKTRTPPRCAVCGGFLKPATISFGQQMPMEKLQRAFDLAGQAELVISVGSTLEVEPAASVPLSAKRAGARYALINQGPTAHDAIADLRLEGEASRILESLVELAGRIKRS